MNTRHLIMLLLDTHGGRLEGKTKLQKELYFLSILLNIPLEYKAHYYGPYSNAVELSLDELIGVGFINSRSESYGVDSVGFEIKKNIYDVSDHGKKWVATLKDENKDEYAKINSFVGKLKDIGDPDYFKLSLAAKAYYVLLKENLPSGLTTDQIKAKSKEVGWPISDADVNVAAAILLKLDLAVQKAQH